MSPTTADGHDAPSFAETDVARAPVARCSRGSERHEPRRDDGHESRDEQH